MHVLPVGILISIIWLIRYTYSRPLWTQKCHQYEQSPLLSLSSSLSIRYYLAINLNTTVTSSQVIIQWSLPSSSLSTIYIYTLSSCYHHNCPLSLVSPTQHHELPCQWHQLAHLHHQLSASPIIISFPDESKKITYMRSCSNLQRTS